MCDFQSSINKPVQTSMSSVEILSYVHTFGTENIEQDETGPLHDATDYQ